MSSNMSSKKGGKGIFRRCEKFDVARVLAVPREPGIYVIYTTEGQPFYVGRSRSNIRERLWKHLQKVGSQKIAKAISQGISLEFEYQEMLSVEQAEAILIRELGTLEFGNLRGEVDPADLY